MEPPTEPLGDAAAVVQGAAGDRPAGAAFPSTAFSSNWYRFTTGLRPGEVAPVYGPNEQVLLTYRSFASVAGVVAALVSAIVGVAGLAAMLFLLAERSPVRAAVALALTVAFTILISLLAPRANVTLYEEGQPALTLSQRATFPSAVFLVAAPNGAELAELRKSALSRLGRNRWTIRQSGRFAGDAVEDSFPGAIVRKFFGKFSRRFETNVLVRHGGMETARIHRRPDAAGKLDVLLILNDALDRRVVVALATLILGREP